MRTLLLKGITILFTCFFIIKLLLLQIFDKNYESLSFNNAVLEVVDYPERGFIYDRHKNLLVTNQLSYDIMVVPQSIIPFDTLAFCNLTGITKEKLKSELKKAKDFSPKLPSVIVNQISKEQYSVFQEHMWKFQGFFIQKKPIRDYKINFAPNILGYVSEVNHWEIKNNDYYKSGDLIGRQGVEKYYEKELRGEKGKKFYQKDKFNRIIGPYQEEKYDELPTPAKNIYLTIDAELQKYGKELMQNKRGGIVAIEPQTGEVLALVTAPSYNPNLLIGKKRSENYTILVNDTLGKPLFDRGLLAEYPPGSPFKVLNALIALQEEVIDPEEKVVCHKGHYYAPNAFMECHCKSGTKNDLLKGIYNSCNTYFSTLFQSIINKYEKPEIGVNKWKNHLSSFGLGNFLGYDLSIGRKGFIPSGEYYNKVYKGGGWKSPTIVSNAIGQGEVLTTPIQLANLTAAIANRGFFYTPHFLNSYQNDSLQNNYTKRITSIDPKHFEIVIDGMEEVINKGTARIARIPGISVCGKTGTAENFTLIDGKKTQLTDHSIFIAFAPKEDPKIAIAVFIENGYWGSRWAAPIASLMIEKYLTQQVKRKWLENRMLKGSLQSEYEKPLSGLEFTINE